MRVTMFGSLPRARNAALRRGLIDVPVIHGKLYTRTQWMRRYIKHNKKHNG